MLYVFRLVVENYRDKTRVLSFREILWYCKTQELYTGTVYSLFQRHCWWFEII